MNAAARVLAQGNLFRGEYRRMTLTSEIVLVLALSLAVLLSAMAIVYVKNHERSLFSDLQTAQQNAAQLQVEWGQLLLEQSTLVTPARVQKIAQERLGMVIPSQKDIVIIH